jgi:hypothetical protein
VVGSEGEFDYKWLSEVVALCATPAEGHALLDQYHSCCSIACGDKLAAQMLHWAQANSDSIK